jgi:hypothetical protein
LKWQLDRPLDTEAARSFRDVWSEDVCDFETARLAHHTMSERETDDRRKSSARACGEGFKARLFSNGGQCPCRLQTELMHLFQSSTPPVQAI